MQKSGTGLSLAAGTARAKALRQGWGEIRLPQSGYNTRAV